MDLAALSAPLDLANVKSRQQAGRGVDYIEAWWAIAEANRIFGFDGWTRETVDVRCVSERARKIGREPNQRDGWGVTYTARVRITAKGEDGEWVPREGCGAGHGIDVDAGQAHESALKEAESDAMKRALMTFGNPFGLALYDKERREVADTAEVARREGHAKACVDAANALRTCADLDALRGCWALIPRAVQGDQDVIDAKDETKAHLTEQAAA